MDARTRGATALDRTHNVGDRGPNTVEGRMMSEARDIVATWLEAGSTTPRGRVLTAIRLLERIARVEATRAARVAVIDVPAAKAPIYVDRRIGATILRPIGGRWWKCLSCGGSVGAECKCCEPPACNCARALAAESK